jgi:hypothetical protein
LRDQAKSNILVCSLNLTAKETPQEKLLLTSDGHKSHKLRLALTDVLLKDGVVTLYLPSYSAPPIDTPDVTHCKAICICMDMASVIPKLLRDSL